ncbi:tRNA (adenosine(37)-N6)-threonylcarbamoyltransferase complex ATPase subunit type 1 TsaE [Vampirovibrio chlorellavorus]|uniref:tRNA (adenosine(37)-N6)-threonylcarbamoyltransferase complex ATPase subunit type 1 TsaE n=1 Tax=Vampirovibrio chlorellavorus TaxID=758823 RepID=UPI0026F02F1C|nr:tRNA (adenosine(37)-N6)-threonylcarbamoyltransferase complex ATPase subunit type 1 TsaE [Vampirovibrio chlorellavorus]
MALLPHQSSFLIPSLADLALFCQTLAPFLQPGDVLALDGPLGAGKTTFTQNLLRVLGVQESVSSPTFVLMNEYASACGPVAHVDLYRLGPERADSLSHELTAMVDEGRSLLLVEWACYGAFLQDLITLQITIQPIFNDSETEATDMQDHAQRRVTLSANRPLTEALRRFERLP